ncbi:hypothetical protein [Staphylococcus gallinarum]|uniref:hypothetical protein n=1 Tax=Staphylococcus gallinarum TaxID=1293 RepID=UPI001E3B54B4|nr:hypothetical protein [Staphylococcus gallinarum]MCD8898880.1 hypothetical protein [Staphylococcus gallinarum]MCD8902069.1 hypothetical protein [Staphylococcus gallinarum]MEB6236723.1 hypothetical protein [Staphylococcus gallinarum]
MKKVIGILLMFTILLAGCGFNSKKEDKPLALSKLGTGEHILYISHQSSKEINKDNEITQIIQVKDGKMKGYNLEESTTNLKELSKKDDKEVVKWAAKQDKHNFDKEYSSREDTLKSLISYEKKGSSDYKKYNEELKDLRTIKYVKPKFHKFNIETTLKNGKHQETMIDLPSLVSVSINDMKEYKEDLENMGMLNVNRKLSTKKIGDSRFSGVQEHYGKHERDNTNVIIKLDKDQSKVSFY